jgi:hypothetical protein
MTIGALAWTAGNAGSRRADLSRRLLRRRVPGNDDVSERLGESGVTTDPPSAGVCSGW